MNSGRKSKNVRKIRKNFRGLRKGKKEKTKAQFSKKRSRRGITRARKRYRVIGTFNPLLHYTCGKNKNPPFSKILHYCILVGCPNLKEEPRRLPRNEGLLSLFQIVS